MFKDLCVDATDADRSTRFYAALLGLTPDPGRPVRLTGDRLEEVVWINAVPEPKTVKNRVHLDVHAGSVAEVLDLGATVVEELDHWTVVADPDGAEFCVFVRDEPPSYRLYELVIDSAEPATIARWWAERFGVQARTEDGVEWWFGDGGGLPFPFVFERVPEAKTVKNRVHWDVWGTPADFVAAGATVLRAPDATIGWHVLADPEGNEFCVFARD